MYDSLKEYEIAKEIFLKDSETILSDILSSKFAKSNKALYYLNLKIDNFLFSIEMMKAENYYSSQALLRLIFEHYLVGYYIWTKTRLENNDQCGEEYYIDYSVSEFFKRTSYNLKIDSIKNNTTKIDLLSHFRKEYPKYKAITQDDLDSIHRKASQFDVRQILNYTLNKTPTDDFFSNANKVYDHFLKEYNNLSSFVHGGPLAENETYHNSPKIDKDQKISDNIEWAKTSSRLMKFYILTLLLDEKKYHAYYKELMKPLIDYIRTGT